MVLTLAWVLFLAGCFGSEQPLDAVETTPTVVATPTPQPVVSESAENAAALTEEPFVYTIEEGDLLPTIADKFNVTQDVILRANPSLNPNVLIAGQTLRIPEATVEQGTVEADRTAAREAGEEIDHVIVEGETFGALATNYQVSQAALLDANAGLDPNTLQIGQLIVIPPRFTGLSPEQVAAFAEPVPVQRQPGEILEHTVQAGDTLSLLADLYSVTQNQIMAANGIDDPNQLAIGDVLIIPPPPTAVPEAGVETPGG